MNMRTCFSLNSLMLIFHIEGTLLQGQIKTFLTSFEK